MHVGCYKQMSAIKEGVIMKLQCIYSITSCDSHDSSIHTSELYL